MQLLVYILVYPLIWALSILPFRLLYLFSDMISFLLYYVIGYRKKVVLDNLKLAFPEKPEKELLKIRRKFYRHFVDVFIETIKTFSLSKKEMNKHFTFTNIEVLNDLYKNGKSTILVGTHYANWEWILSLNPFLKYKGYGAFTRVNNKYFNNQIVKSRSKFGANLVVTSKMKSTIESNEKNNVQSMYGLLSDQSPQLKRTKYWGEFFGIKVPIHVGAETLAKKYDMNIVLFETKKIKRGYYNATFTVITDNATTYPDYELTDIFLRKTEEHIREQPEFYFWTHKRFKHMDKFVEEN